MFYDDFNCTEKQYCGKMACIIIYYTVQICFVWVYLFLKNLLDLKWVIISFKKRVMIIA